MSVKFDDYIILNNIWSRKRWLFFSKLLWKIFEGGNKKTTKGNYQRTNEGVYCHHVNENMYGQLSKAYRIKDENLEFEHQKKRI